MNQPIPKVAILGSGVMGSQIAAHLTNAKIPVLVFDLSQEVAQKGIDFSRSLKPNPYYSPRYADQITVCNYDDHLKRLQECSWIIEVIAERLDWKQELYRKILPHLNPQAVVTSNTSGLGIASLMSGMPIEFRQRFFITHFFNPPRYMKLVEIITGPDTDPTLIPPMVKVLEEVMGKGVVYAEDTPNFVANRIGIFGMMATLAATRQFKLTIEDVDALTGSIIGRPKSATFRTADVVGLDTLAFVAANSYENCPEDEERDILKIPPFLQQLLKNKWLGQKTGQGFYKKIAKGVIHVLDLETMEYRPQKKRHFDGIRLARGETHLPGKLRALVHSADVAGQFTWRIMGDTLLYAAKRLGEITSDIVNIDRAMCWGYGWELGPFQIWDQLGVQACVERLQNENRSIPQWILDMLATGYTHFYRWENGRKYFYDPRSKNYELIPVHSRQLQFEQLRKSGNVIHRDWSASLMDMGDGVAGIDFHSVLKPDMNPIDGSFMESLDRGREWVEEHDYKGLVISGDNFHFSIGANLNLILNNIYRQNWDAIDEMVRLMQNILQQLHLAPFPVVAAPYGLALGGGFETIGACHHIVAAAELYCGLVEVGVGLIPGGGGNLRLMSRLLDRMSPNRPGPFPVVQKVFETVAFARVSTSAKEAQALGYLTHEDTIVINRDYLLGTAKATVLKLAEDFHNPGPRNDILLPGLDGRLVLEASIADFQKAGKISAHDALIGKRLAYVLTGGDKAHPLQPVSEQYILDIEREMFLSLCGETKTLQRIEHMLTKGRPLRN